MKQYIQHRMIWLWLSALAAHLAFLFVIIPYVSQRLGPSYNQDLYADGYDQLAENLRSGNGYRFYPDTAQTLMREPGYPILLAGLMAVSGNSFGAVKLANLVLAFGTAWLILQLAKRIVPNIFPGRKLLVASTPLLFLTYPGALVAESRGGIEVIFGFLITLLIFTIYIAIESPNWLKYAMSGAVLGATVLVRSTPILFPVVLLLFLLFMKRNSIALAVRNVGTMVFVMLLVISPWIIRNYRITGKFIPTASVLGVSAQAGEYINQHLFSGKPWWLLDREASRERDKIALTHGYRFEDGSEGYYQTFYNAGDEIKFSHVLTQDVMKDYKQSPVLFIRCLGQNIFNFWFSGKTWMATTINFFIQIPYLLFAAAGIIHCIKNKQMKVISLLLIYIGYDMAVHLPILAQARYSIPMMPLLCVLSAVGVIAWRERTATASISSDSACATARPGRFVIQAD